MKPIRGVAVALICLSLVLAWFRSEPGAWAKPSREAPPANPRGAKRAVIGVERPGTSIIQIPFGGAPIGYSFAVYGSKPPFWLDSLEQLKGRVQINSMEDVLKFVRFRTNHEYRFVWHGDIAGEVCPISAALISTDGLHVPSYPTSGPWASGLFGVLSDDAFRTSNCEAPTVTFSHSRWIVTRTVLVDRGTADVFLQVWRETVTRDGGYVRETLSESPPPKIENTTWWFGARPL